MILEGEGARAPGAPPPLPPLLPLMLYTLATGFEEC